MGLFDAFIDDPAVRLVGVEAGGRRIAPGDHAARFAGGHLGVLHGTKSLVLQDADGNILPTHSVSAGLDYPSVGPEHAWLQAKGRTEYAYAGDEAAIDAFQWLGRTEGILPALESAHAIAWARDFIAAAKSPAIVLVNLSGRGDKDVEQVRQMLDAAGGAS
jgi:tryptophan synthase beta chain